MKPQRFEIGQAVTSVSREWSKHRVTDDDNQTPKYGEIYHVQEYVLFDEDEWWITISELSPTIGYEEKGFVPVITDHQLLKALEEVPDTVTI